MTACLVVYVLLVSWLYVSVEYALVHQIGFGALSVGVMLATWNHPDPSRSTRQPRTPLMGVGTVERQHHDHHHDHHNDHYQHQHQHQLTRNTRLAACLFVGGFVLWNLDNVFCDQIRTARKWMIVDLSSEQYGYAANTLFRAFVVFHVRSLTTLVSGLFQLHAWWHILSGLGGHLILLCLIWKQEPDARLTWKWWLLPWLVIPRLKDKYEECDEYDDGDDDDDKRHHVKDNQHAGIVFDSRLTRRV